MKTEEELQNVFTEGFNHFKNQFVAIIVGTLIAVIGSIFIITAPPLFFGIYYMALKIIGGEEVKMNDVFKGFDYFITSWAMLIIGAILVLIGFVFLIIPGIVLLILFQYAVPLAIKEKLGAVDALQKSFSIGKENIQFTVVLFIIVWVINGIGAALSIGWVITHPFTAICISIAALKLAGKSKK